MNELFDHPSATLRWLEMPEGQTLLAYVGSLLELSRKQLEKESDPTELFRRQGKIEALKIIAGLPEELRELIKRKAA